MEIRQVKYLLAAIQSGSLGKAALELEMATSALSQQITRLESELSTRLLVRGASGVTPTEAGAAFSRHATLAIRNMDAAVAAAQGARISGMVSLGLAPTTSSVLALPLIEAMARRYPNVRLQLVEGMSGHLANMLKMRQLDLAILFEQESVTFARGEAIPLIDESLFLIGCESENNAEDTIEISLPDASFLPLIMPSKGHGLRASLDKSFAAAKVRPNIIMEIDSLSVIMDAVKAKLGYTIQPGAALARATSPELRVRRIADAGARRTNFLVSLPEHELSPAALGLQSQIRKIVASLVRNNRWLGATLQDS